MIFVYGVFSSSPFSPWVTHGVYPSFRKIAISVSPFAILYLLVHTWLRLVWKIAQVPGVLVIWGMTHDGSMVLLYMVLHGSHQYTPVMLALIYQHHGSYGWCHDSIPQFLQSLSPGAEWTQISFSCSSIWRTCNTFAQAPANGRVIFGRDRISRNSGLMDIYGYLIFDPTYPTWVCLKWGFIFGNIASSMVPREWW
jgi:hypothetical protein